MSSSQPLQTLLIVKRAAEESAAQLLARRTAHRAAAQATYLDLEAEAAAARDELRQRRASAASIGADSAARAVEREQFWARLAAAAASLRDHARAYRTGALAQAETDLALALTAFRVAREAREVVERLLGKAEAAERQLRARRDEAALDEQVQAARAARRGRQE